MILHAGPVIGERGDLRVIDCHHCGYAHLEKMPSPSVLGRYYTSEFWTGAKAGWRELLEQQWDWDEARYGDWLSLIEPMTDGRRLYDVGCGYGGFMHAARNRGWNVAGCELSADACNYARHRLGPEANINQCGWEQIDWAGAGGKNFDCIAALWLLEHLPDPLAFLKWCRAHLYSSGSLLLAVPNDFTAIQFEVNERADRPFWWIDLTHLNYFTWSSLSNLLGIGGFGIRRRLTQHAIEEHLRDHAMDYTADQRLGLELHGYIRQQDMEMARDERIGHYAGLALQGRGREIIIIAGCNGR